MFRIIYVCEVLKTFPLITLKVLCLFVLEGKNFMLVMMLVNVLTMWPTPFIVCSTS